MLPLGTQSGQDEVLQGKHKDSAQSFDDKLAVPTSWACWILWLPQTTSAVAALPRALLPSTRLSALSLSLSSLALVVGVCVHASLDISADLPSGELTATSHIVLQRFGQSS